MKDNILHQHCDIVANGINLKGRILEKSREDYSLELLKYGYDSVPVGMIECRYLIDILSSGIVLHIRINKSLYTGFRDLVCKSVVISAFVHINLCYLW